MSLPPRTLSIAHESLAVLAGIGLVLVLAILWDDSVDLDLGPLRRPAQMVTYATVTFLYASAWLEFRVSDLFRANDRPRGRVLLYLAAVNALVLLTATLTMMRGDLSRAYLAGQHQSLAALGTLTCLGLALAVITWIVGRGAAAPATRGRGSAEAWVPWVLYTASAVTLVVALGLLESSPLPHGS